MEFPAQFHIWGGNTYTAMLSCDMVVAASVSETATNPSVIKASNPSLIALTMSALDPFNSNYQLRRSHSWTYGGGLSDTPSPWPGVVDTLEPNPQYTIRGFTGTSNPFPAEGTGDYGLWQQADHIQGFALYRASTASFIAQECFYSWKLQQAAARGWDGMWSDNVFTGTTVSASWAYGSTWAGHSATDWDNNLVALMNHLRTNGVPLCGGNTIVRSTNNAVRAASNVGLFETLEFNIGRGRNGATNMLSANPSGFASTLAEAQGWFAQGTGNKYLGVMHNIDPTDTTGRNFGLAAATILGGAYMVYSTEEGWHASLSKPTELAANRHRLGTPVANATRSGNTFTRQFQHGSVQINFDTWSSSFTYT